MEMQAKLTSHMITHTESRELNQDLHSHGVKVHTVPRRHSKED